MGMVEFLGTITVIIPPAVSMPRDIGVTSSKSKSFVKVLLPTSIAP